MNASAIAVDALLAFAVVVELLCCIGVLVMRTALDRLHYLGPAVFFGPLCIMAATMVSTGVLSQAGIKTLVIFLVLLVTGPIDSYVIARVIRHRAAGRLAVRPSDRVQHG